MTNPSKWTFSQVPNSASKSKTKFSTHEPKSKDNVDALTLSKAEENNKEMKKLEAEWLTW